jgi:hypothetical protein
MQRQIDEREGKPVVQPSLSGQAEADRVLTAFNRMLKTGRLPAEVAGGRDLRVR